MPYQDYTTTSTIGDPFTVTVVRLIDGFIGQVMFADQIVFQSELQEDVESARKVAREVTIAAVKKLFS